MQNALHHISKRKRVSNKLDEYPSKRFWIRLLDRLLVIIAVIGPLMGISQLWDIFYLKDVAGLSLISWASWTFFNLFWILYGFIHKEKPIIITYLLWFLLNLSIVIGILLYS